MSFKKLLVYRQSSDDGLIKDNYIETEHFEEGFSSYYNENIRPLAKEYNLDRAKKLSIASKRAKITALLLLFSFTIFAVLVFHGIMDFVLALVILVLGYAISTFWFLLPLRKYTSNIKRSVFPLVLSFLGNYSFSNTYSWKTKEWNESGLIPNYDDAYNNDAITGDFYGGSFEIFESHLTKDQRTTENRTRTDTLFRGIVLTMDIDLLFKGKTIVLRDKGKLRNWFDRISSSLHRVQINDVTLEKIYEIYSTEQSQTFVSSLFLKSLDSLMLAYGGDSMQCCFEGNKVLIMIDSSVDRFETGDLFDVNSFRNDTKTFLRDSFQAITFVNSVYETLKLDKTLSKLHF